MTIRRRADPTPDLFASLPRRPEAPTRRAVPQAQPEQDIPTSRPRLLLPKDLAGSLERLGDAEVDALLAAVTAEAKRRGRLPPSRTGGPAVDVKSRPRRAVSHGGAASLTIGKLNAVRAAFRAGVKPSAIAREFGISQADVKRALAGDGKKPSR